MWMWFQCFNPISAQIIHVWSICSLSTVPKWIPSIMKRIIQCRLFTMLPSKVIIPNFNSEPWKILQLLCPGNMEMFRLLCDRGAEINAKLLSGRTPLHWAASEGDLLDTKTNHLNLNQSSKMQVGLKWFECFVNSALKLRIGMYTEEHHFTMQLITVNWLRLQTINSKKFVWFWFNYQHSDKVEVVRILDQYGAEIDTKPTDGTTPFYRAALHGKNYIFINSVPE